MRPTARTDNRQSRKREKEESKDKIIKRKQVFIIFV